MLLKNLVESLQSKKRIPKELLQQLNELDFLIIEQELDLKVLTYNQVCMVCTYYWDFPI